MVLNELDGKYLRQMIYQAASHLSQNKEKINALNVFPVPDGDTGTNMDLTFSSGANEIKKHAKNEIKDIASHFAKGLLMGARGNSGVILSQLFRGFSKAVEAKDVLHSLEFAQALEKGVETAYKAVIKPVEGTILTVAKDAAKKAVSTAKNTNDITEVMKETVAEAKASLSRTPQLLPVLKEVGVVDSGGQGLVVIYEAFLAVLEGKDIADVETDAVSMEEMIRAEHHKNAQSHIHTDDIEFGYCTEFMIHFRDSKLKEQPFEEEAFRNKLSKLGDSLLVVADDELVKVHIHSEYPGELLTYAQRYGELINIKIDNMREQHSSIVQREEAANVKKANTEANIEKEKERFGFVTVAAGKGLVELFKGLGNTEVIFGGQTMNPSTEDIVQAIEKINAETVFVLPNNGNIMMAAEQAAKVASSHVKIIPTKTIPQGIAALFAFNPDLDDKMNEKAMKAAMSNVKSGQVTYAVRDTAIDRIQIKENDFLSISEGKIVSTAPTSEEAAKNLLNEMITDDNELVTIIYGENISEAETEVLEEYINENFSFMDVEIQNGMQPVYSYIIAVE
ncbi:hypothetical protein DCC39_00830 [Pueribacillus theae]|uniref:DhaL domain-containing protein n=1 Tax=Pueribacillus theae TaxID=2171751 RepID=A0A2U1K7F7_9BACI|nr:DAK2 domain-containing protein [Pueribacillus theae]PWA13467.1 hypothetical protein DCC39_00830 [Pueribacillus theae]